MQWKIKVNAGKSENIVFTRKRRTYSNLILNDLEIPNVNNVKYLGITFQHNGKFNNHCTNVIKTTNHVITKLWKFIGPYSKMNRANKLTIYKLYIRSLMTHNIFVWEELCATKMKSIQRLQNKCLRMVLQLRPNPVTFKQVKTATIHAITSVPTIQEFLKRLKTKFLDKCLHHKNPLVRQIAHQY